MSIKTAARKDALLLFIAMVALHFAWGLIAKKRDSLGHIFGVSAGAAVIVYLIKRKDLFD
jgi:hypothetical protein